MPSTATQPPRSPAFIRRVLAGVLLMGLGVLAGALPLLPFHSAAFCLGLILISAGIIDTVVAHAGLATRRLESAWFGGSVSIVAGGLLLAVERFVFPALAMLLGVSWVIDGGFRVASAVRGGRESKGLFGFLDGVLNILVGAAIALQWPISGAFSLGIAIALRLISDGWTTLVGQTAESRPQAGTPDCHPDARLGLPAHAEFATLRQQWESEVDTRERLNRYWRVMFIITFFAIHFGRMNATWDLVGLISPVGAVFGDVILGLLITYVLFSPTQWFIQWLSRPIERRSWNRAMAAHDSGGGRGPIARLRSIWLMRRLRGAYEAERNAGSLTGLMGRGMQIGLPIAAVLIAMNPIWGFSWYFNSENWVTGIWEHWAAHRTDDWRLEMVRAVRKAEPDGENPEFHRLRPPGIDGTGDFGFIVIGDTGEGDPSQLCLKDRIIEVGRQDHIKFLVVSSDVIYPSGTMSDYEPKFYLPFKGFTKPIYAIPGNHDWFDAGESFMAHFLTPVSARAALLGRREADHGLTTTTEKKIDGMVAEAQRLQSLYGVACGKQHAPYMEIQTDRFAMIMVDTGILKCIDEDQRKWLNAALARAKGKFIFALTGHPFYAGGFDQRVVNPGLRDLSATLIEAGASICMAGDTHDFEYYDEPTAKRTVRHFVNGGGGAYLSIGTALDWPRTLPVEQCGHYPRADAIVRKLNEETPTLKRPLWRWVRDWHAWPMTSEAMASAFNYNRAPFYQSFMEVRVERSKNRVRLLLHSADGQLRWKDLYRSGPPGGAPSPDDFVEFVVPIEG